MLVFLNRKEKTLFFFLLLCLNVVVLNDVIKAFHWILGLFFFKLCICDKLTEAKWTQGCLHFACRWPFAMQFLWYYQPLNVYKFSMYLRICLMWKIVEKRLFSNNFTVLDLVFSFLNFLNSLCLSHRISLVARTDFWFIYFFNEEIMALKSGFRQRK